MASKLPEDYMYEHWRTLSHESVHGRSRAQRQAARALVDVVQRVLEDYSAYGHRLVWNKT